MAKNILEDFVKYAPAKDVQAADRLIELKKQNKLWEAVELCFEIWARRNPKEWKSFLFHVDEVRETRKTTRGFKGVSRDKETGGYTQYLLDIPQDVVYMLRKLYTPDELPMDKKFFNQLARRFPKFRVSHKV
jgi:hypothetical protein